MPQDSKFTSTAPTPPALPPQTVKERLMQQIIESPSPYNAAFSTVQTAFAPLVTALDGSDNQRLVTLVDPLKVAAAQAYGISAEDYLKFSLAQQGVKLNDKQASTLAGRFDQKDGDLRFTNTNTTDPGAIGEPSVSGAACVIAPWNEVGYTPAQVKGFTPQQQEQFVDFHEYFHCLNDGYNGKTNITAGQQRESFADTGAAIMMIRQGADPSIIDKVIAWRDQTYTAGHGTEDSLKTLRDFIQRNGVDSIRKLDDKGVLDLNYAITTQAAPSLLKYAGQKVDEALSPVTAARELGQMVIPKIGSDAPKGWNPYKALEDKAMALGGKITPATLLQANMSLQAQYKQQQTADPNNPAYNDMMIATQSAFAKQVKIEDYATVNAQRGGKLTDQDRSDIAFVTGKPVAAPATPKAPTPQKLGA